MPLGFDERIGGRAARAAREITQLRSWYTDASQSANSGLAEYFRGGASRRYLRFREIAAARHAGPGLRWQRAAKNSPVC